jgi:hypothetical protein
MHDARPPTLPPADPALAAEIARYFEGYASAYDAFDAAAIAAHFAVPSYILHQDRAAPAFATREALVANMERLNAINRESRYGRATFAPPSVIAFAPGHVLATVPWTIRDVDGAVLWRFTCTYNLVLQDDGWKIVVCTNHAPDA